MDQELKRESEPFERGAPVESRVEEHREVEEASPEQGDTTEGLDRGSPQARAEVTRFLQPSIFPADREAILESARTEGATGEVLRQLQDLPHDVTFTTAQDVWEALGRDRP